MTQQQLSLNKVGEEELLFHTFGSKVPTRIKCARVQVKIRDILDKDEVIIEALEIDEDESFNEEDNLKCLLTFVDQNGIYRLKTKIIRRDDTEDFRYPIVLSFNHKLVHRLLFDHHLLLSHAGVQFVLTHLQQRFWIVKGRKTIQSVLSKCILCKKYKARAVETLPSTLPEDRIRDASEVMGQDNLKRSDWLIGRVIDIYPGKDNQVRIVKVKAG
ncbi:uncharacterized protein NPIL_395561 [Nephila pilipes]|uniref:Integrase zinc-binding domain-containing protein n=1 Tax=Nephila pilipes TaxID=299642 RepID=A0A8X6IR62_NEPPI|nr:uncharacterized protein NPIL_395561 [Nephila pilipes]